MVDTDQALTPEQLQRAYDALLPASEKARRRRARAAGELPELVRRGYVKHVIPASFYDPKRTRKLKRTLERGDRAIRNLKDIAWKRGIDLDAVDKKSGRLHRAIDRRLTSSRMRQHKHSDPPPGFAKIIF